MTKEKTHPVEPLAEAPIATPVQHQEFPLFFKKPAALEKTRHARATLKQPLALDFARASNSIALNLAEFIEASKYYPIAFTIADEPTALAIVGLERENYFIDAKGHWLADRYIPAYVRQYPFILFEDTANKQLFLCVDELSELFSADGAQGGNALFDADGNPSPMTKRAMEFSMAYFHDHTLTRQFARDLKQHDLLKPYQSQVKLASGRAITLSGFAMIDEAVFNALPDEVFLEFRHKGWLPLIYWVLASASNWKRLGSLAEQQASGAAQ